MQRLELDFRRGRAPSPWVGRLLLAAAAAFAADVGFSYYEVQKAVQANKQTLVQAQPRTAPISLWSSGGPKPAQPPTSPSGMSGSVSRSGSQ